MSAPLPEGQAGPASVAASAAPLTGGRKKRLKIAVACEPCRAKKIKCDGVTPVCNPCARKFGKSDQCRYSSLSPRAGHLSSVSKKPYSKPFGGQNRATSSQRNVPSQPRQLPFLRPLERSKSRASDTSYADSAPDPETTVDSMNAIVEGQSAEFFGGSSAGSFTGQIKAAIEERMGRVASSDSIASHRQKSRLHGAMVPKRKPVDLSNQVLPPRRLADELMNIYWTYIAPLYPFLDRKRWEGNYVGMFTGSSIDMDEGLFFATMNVIFALSTQLREDMDKQKREHNSNQYFERGSEPLHGMMLDSGSVELVQYLLLTAQYLQCTSSPHHTWMVVGSACRIAQSLGLHLSATSDSTTSIRQREVYRRLWHGCVLLDRMVSITHGRPVMIDAKLARSVSFPQSESDSSELEGMIEPAFFVKSLQLYEITHELSVSLYSASSMKVKQAPEFAFKELAEIVRIDGLLSEWEESVPQQLVVQVAVSHGATPLREAVILRLRMLHTRILLLRPTLALMCLSKSQPSFHNTSNSLHHRIYQQCAKVCVETAQSTIRTIVQYATSDGTVGLLPAWWYRLYYLFAASTVLIAAKLRPDLFPEVEINQSWMEAIQTLQKLENVSVSAQKCIAALHMLASKVLQTSEAESASAATDVWRPALPENEDISSHPLQSDIPDMGFNIDFATEFPIDFIVDVDDLSWLNYVATWNGASE